MSSSTLPFVAVAESPRQSDARVNRRPKALRLLFRRSLVPAARR